jgi:ribosomal-protein-serine acetyltransferase
MKKFKNKLIGKRLTLKRTTPNIKLAKTMFETIEANRKHLKPWFSWEKQTQKIEDTLKHLFDKEAERKEKIEYGIYIKNQYIGNIGIFGISEKNKSAEIGYWLSSEFTRNGYMTEAVKIVEKEFFVNIKLNRIYIKCDERNLASIGVAKKCAYKLEGKYREDNYSEYFKDFRNTLVFSKLKKEYKR